MPDTITTAVPQQSPPANAIQHPAKVYLLSRRLPDIVHLVQYDQTLPVLAVELLQGDAPYTVPEDAAVNIRMAKPVPSNKKVYNPAYGISEDRHTVYIAVTPQMTVVAGCTNPVIEVVVDGGIACTGTLRLEIDPNPVQETDLIDTDEYKTLEEILAEAQAAAQIVQDNEQALQDVHNNLTAIQNAAANAQAAAASAQDAEDAADRAAIESQKALGFRSYFGGQVVPDANGDLDPSRPMSTPTAASVTIKARGDRIAGLTMAGKTTQGGTGDPSPENIRPISGVGMYDKMVVYDGSVDEGWTVQDAAKRRYRIPSPQNSNWSAPDGHAATSSYLKPIGTVWTSLENGEFFISPSKLVSSSGEDVLVVCIASCTNLTDFRDYLAAHPLTVWYRSVNYAKSTGPFYTVVELSQDPYRAVGFELNQPLFDGDSLKVGGKSGCDQMVVLDGTEKWSKAGNVTNAYFANNVLPVIANSPISGVAPLDECKAIASHTLAYNPLTAWDNLLVNQFSVSAHQIGVRVPGFDTAEEFKEWLSTNPLTIFYRSVNYTPKADIAVALESHAMGYAVFSGGDDYSYDWQTVGEYPRGAVSGVHRGPEGIWCQDLICSHFMRGEINLNNHASGVGVFNNTAYMRNDNLFSDLNTFKQFLSSKYSAGTPVQVVYELAAPVKFARPVPTMIAQPGEDGTFTVTGENSLSVLLKAFQDGGDAATIEGHTWADILAAIQAATASTANALLEEKTNV